MPWVRLDDSFAEHPKVIGLSDAAFRTHVNAICYCNRQLTDGRVPSVLGNGCTEELLDAGVWERNGSGFLVHDYLDYQPSKEEVLAEREKAAERMRRLRSNGVRPNNKENITRSSVTPVPVPVPGTEPKEELEARREQRTLSTAATQQGRRIAE